MPKKLSQIIVYEADGTTAVNVSGSNDLIAAKVVKPPRFRYELGKPFEVKMELMGPTSWGTRGPISKRNVLHFIYDDGSRKGARIRRLIKRDTEENMTIEAVELIRDLAQTPMYRTLSPSNATSQSVFLSNLTTANVLGEILSSTWNAPSHFQAGTVASAYSSETPQVAGEGITHAEALEILQEQLGCEIEMAWNSGDSKWDVNIVEEIGGGTASDRPIHGPTGGSPSSRANRIKLDVTYEDTDYFSRIIPTAGSPPVGIQISEWVVDSVTDLGSGIFRVFLQGNPILVEDAMVGLYVNTGVGGSGEIVNSGPASGASLCFIDVDVSGVINPADVIVFREGSASGLYPPYLIDNSREASGGVVSKLFHFPEVVPYENIFETDSSVQGSGNMSSGSNPGSGWMADGMEAVGSPTTSVVSNPQYVQHGTQTLKVEADEGEGVQTEDLPWISSDVGAMSVWARVIVVSGRVRLTAKIDGDSAGGSGTAIFPDGEDQIEFNSLSPSEGWISFDLKDDVTAPADINFRLLAIEDGTVFYLDALTVTLSREGQPFREDMGKNALFRAAARYLKENGTADPVYKGVIYDPGHLSASLSEVVLGSNVEIRGQFDSSSGTYNLSTDGRIRVLEEVDDWNTGRIEKTVEIARAAPSLLNRFKQKKLPPLTQKHPPTTRPIEKVVNLTTDLSNEPGGERAKAFVARRAVSGGPVVNALYISDPEDTTSTADGVLIRAGSDGVRWKLQEQSGGYDVRLWGGKLADAAAAADNNAAIISAASALNSGDKILVPTGMFYVNGNREDGTITNGLDITKNGITVEVLGTLALVDGTNADQVIKLSGDDTVFAGNIDYSAVTSTTGRNEGVRLSGVRSKAKYSIVTGSADVGPTTSNAFYLTGEDAEAHFCRAIDAAYGGFRVDGNNINRLHACTSVDHRVKGFVYNDPNATGKALFITGGFEAEITNAFTPGSGADGFLFDPNIHSSPLLYFDAIHARGGHTANGIKILLADHVIGGLLDSEVDSATFAITIGLLKRGTIQRIRAAGQSVNLRGGVESLTIDELSNTYQGRSVAFNGERLRIGVLDVKGSVELSDGAGTGTQRVTIEDARLDHVDGASGSLIDFDDAVWPGRVEVGQFEAANGESLAPLSVSMIRRTTGGVGIYRSSSVPTDSGYENEALSLDTNGRGIFGYSHLGSDSWSQIHEAEREAWGLIIETAFDKDGAGTVHVPGAEFVQSSDGAVSDSTSGGSISLGSDYLEFASTRGLGARMETINARRFRLERIVETGFEGRVAVAVFDSSGTRLTSADPGHPYVSGANIAWNGSYAGGTYRTNQDGPADQFFKITDDVHYIEVYVTGGTAVVRLREARLFVMGGEMTRSFTQSYTKEVFRENAGDPTGSVTPRFEGEEILDTSNSIWYRATGLTNSDWHPTDRQADVDANDSISNAGGTDAAIIDAIRDELHDLKDKLRAGGIIAS